MPGSEPTDLLARVEQVRARALADGALAPIETALEELVDGGIPFQLRTAAAPDRKHAATVHQRVRGRDPFADPDPVLRVADVSATHLALLNKFPVIDAHLLLVTRAYEEQTAPLDDADFEALAWGLDGIDGLGFYNAGESAGASQPHKHLQLVAPLGPGRFRAPVETVLPASLDGARVVRLPALPFAHAATALNPSRPSIAKTPASSLAAAYARLADTLGGTDAPYNLLVTRDWMLMVRRSRAHWRGMEVNALGFAGSLFARGREQVEAVRREGPLVALASVVGD